MFFKEGLSYFVIQETVFSSTVFTVLHSKLIQFCSIVCVVICRRQVVVSPGSFGTHTGGYLFQTHRGLFNFL